MVKINTTASSSFAPTVVPPQDYARLWNAEDISKIPEIPSRTTNKLSKSIAIQVTIGILIIVAVGGAIAIPFTLALTALQTTTEMTSTNLTTGTTATTTTATTTTATTTTTSTTTETTTSVTTTTVTTTITAILTAYGPQLNFNPATLSGAWSLCYSALYSVPMYPNISSILASCNKDKLLLGCRPVGNTVLTLAAMGNRADVLYNCSASNSITRVANGVGWYFAMNAGNWNSWGFVMGTNAAVRGNCDGDMATNAAYRLCWHMVGPTGGWRCGATGSLDTSTTWEKVIYHAM